MEWGEPSAPCTQPLTNMSGFLEAGVTHHFGFMVSDINLKYSMAFQLADPSSVRYGGDMIFKKVVLNHDGSATVVGLSTPGDTPAKHTFYIKWDPKDPTGGDVRLHLTYSEDSRDHDLMFQLDHKWHWYWNPITDKSKFINEHNGVYLT